MTIIVQCSAPLIERLNWLTVILLDAEMPDSTHEFEMCRQEVLRGAIERGLRDIEAQCRARHGIPVPISVKGGPF